MAVCSKGLLEIRIYIGNQVAIYLTNIHTVNQDNQYNFWSMSEDSGTVCIYNFIYIYLIITCTLGEHAKSSHSCIRHYTEGSSQKIAA